MLIQGANVYLPHGGFVKTGVRFGETVTETGACPPNAGEEIYTAEEGDFLIPGLIDIHTHGALGEDFSDGSAGGIEKLSRYYAAHGVTSFCATTVTLGERELFRACETAGAFTPQQGCAACAGVYLEGPFIAAAKKGAQNPLFIQKPDIGLLKRLMRASGDTVRFCTVAPETDGAPGFIAEAGKLCSVSLAHTNADYETASRAFGCGASQITHLYNAMTAFHHREPGVIGAAMDAGAYAELICDGIHVHPSAVRAAFRLFPGRVILISDSLRCAGMEDGTYSLGGQEILLSNGRATLRGGTVAGSCISLADALQSAIAFGVPAEAAVAAATENPARALGLSHRIGCIQAGAQADLVLTDGAFRVKRVFVRGREAVAL